MTKLKLLTTTLLILLGVFVPKIASAAATPGGFDPLGAACDPTTTNAQAAKSPACQQDKTQQSAAGNPDPAVTKINDAADILALIAGAGSLVIVVYSAFNIVTAGGAGPRSGENTNRIRQARSSLTSALIGLVIIALAWTIVTFVTNRLIAK